MVEESGQSGSVISESAAGGGMGTLIKIALVLLVLAFGFWLWRGGTLFPATPASPAPGSVRKSFGTISLLIPPSMSVNSGSAIGVMNNPQAVGSWLVGGSDVVRLLTRPTTDGSGGTGSLRESLKQSWALNIQETRPQATLKRLADEIASGAAGPRPSSHKQRTIGGMTVEVLTYPPVGGLMEQTLYMVQPKLAGNQYFITIFTSREGTYHAQVDAVINSLR